LSPAADLRYQLLTACAGVMAEAKRRGMIRAVMLVHEFVTAATSDANHKRNADDLARFLARIVEHPPNPVVDGHLYGPYETSGVSGVQLWVGKIRRVIRPAVSS
jgi:hypothetical protein